MTTEFRELQLKAMTTHQYGMGYPRSSYSIFTPEGDIDTEEVYFDWGGHPLSERIHRSHDPIPSKPPIIVQMQDAERLEKLEKDVKQSIDIGLHNQRLLEQMQETAGDNGIGAIHSLDHGRVVLNQPLIYSSRVMDGEVLVAIEEFGVYGSGDTEAEAMTDLTIELWRLFQDLADEPVEALGPKLVTAVRVLKQRIDGNAMDA